MYFIYKYIRTCIYICPNIYTFNYVCIYEIHAYKYVYIYQFSLEFQLRRRRRVGGRRLPHLTMTPTPYPLTHNPLIHIPLTYDPLIYNICI
jgi:hypothetical protein